MIGVYTKDWTHPLATFSTVDLAESSDNAAGVELSHCLFGWNESVAGASVVTCASSVTNVFTGCNDLWQNDGLAPWPCGWVDGLDGNFAADPMHCAADPFEDVRIHADSPCRPGVHNGVECGIVGSGSVECGVAAAEETPGASPVRMWTTSPLVEGAQISVVGVQRIELVDVGGRVRRVWSLGTPGAEAGSVVTWDGRDDNGNTLPRGVYWLRARGGQRAVARKVVFVK